MGENLEQNDPDKELRELRAEYLLKRLDHTLTHTQSSSRLIYLLDGAVLALAYFVIQTLGPTRGVIGYSSVFVFLLTGLNGLHARLIRLQHSYYRGLDGMLRELLSVAEVPRQPFRVFRSTHGVYRAMHLLTAAALFALALAMLLYGLGYFPALPLAPGKVGG